MWKDFKAFVMRGNVLDLAVAVVIGAAFGAIVKSFVDDLLMPVVGLLGRADYTNLFVVLRPGPKAPEPYATLADAKAAGAATLNYGLFLTNLVSFVIVAFAIFLLVRAVTRLYAKPAPAPAKTKPCPFCATEIPLAATRCPNCTSQLAA